MGGMRYRKLRIAWSVVWGLAAVLLIVLWVRSYWTCESIARWNVELSSGFGVVRFYVSSDTIYDRWLWSTIRADEVVLDENVDFRTFALRRDTDGGYLNVPHWFLLLVVLLSAVASWTFRWRFTLRTLLIATTLVAVVLGLAVYAAGK
jgi:hypothetical protein